MFIPSEYQKNIFDFVENGEGHGIVDAVAGSGKTTTLIQIFNRLPSHYRVLFVAFNKHIVEEFSSKAPANVDICTTHSLGRRIFNEYIKVEKPESKTYKLLKNKLQKVNHEFTPSDFSKISSFVIKIISFMKNSVKDATDEDIEELIEHHNMILPDFVVDEPTENHEISRELFFSIIKNVYIESGKRFDIIDFDDMLYMPVRHSDIMRFPKYDFILFDEAQDANESQVQLVLNCLAENGRIIAVGDTSQSLYGFRGADVNSMSNFKERMNATELPLSITYRCPKTHVQFAKTYTDRIEAAPDAIEGKIENIPFYEIYDTLHAGDLVLCRNNAPLIKPCFKLIVQGIKATIKGRNIGTEMVSFIKKMGAKSNTQLSQLMAMWLDDIIEECEMQDKNPEIYIDKVDCINTLIELVGTENVNDVITYIKKIFSDTNNSEITLSTVHRAKGLEADNVFVLFPDKLMPSQYAQKDWEIQQEANIEYVAYTRAKQNLYIVPANA